MLSPARMQRIMERSTPSQTDFSAPFWSQTPPGVVCTLSSHLPSSNSLWNLPQPSLHPFPACPLNLLCGDHQGQMCFLVPLPSLCAVSPFLPDLLSSLTWLYILTSPDQTFLISPDIHVHLSCCHPQLDVKWLLRMSITLPDPTLWHPPQNTAASFQLLRRNIWASSLLLSLPHSPHPLWNPTSSILIIHLHINPLSPPHSLGQVTITSSLENSAAPSQSLVAAVDPLWPFLDRATMWTLWKWKSNHVLHGFQILVFPAGSHTLCTSTWSAPSSQLLPSLCLPLLSNFILLFPQHTRHASASDSSTHCFLFSLLLG